MKNKILAIIAAIALAAALVPAHAALTIPGTISSSNPAAGNATLFFNKVTTASTNSGSVPIGQYAQCGLHYVVTQGGSTSNITLTLQGSNDNANWVSYSASALSAANVISNSTSNQNDFYTFFVPPANYVRASLTQFGSNPVTTTLNLFCK
jgi:hypothetical protein